MVLFWNRIFSLAALGILIFSCGSGSLTLSEMKKFKYVEIGDEYYKNKNLPFAQKYYEKALSSDPKLNNDLYFLSRMIKVFGEHNNIKEIKKIKNRINNDESEIYYYCLGKIEYYLKNFEVSKTYFKKAKGIAPEDKKDFYNCLIDKNCES